MLHITPADLLPADTEPRRINAPAGRPKRDPTQLHGSLLAQTILTLPADVSAPISDSLLAQNPDTLVALCKHPQASHVVQKVLNSPHATVPNRRKLLNLLRGRFVELALDTIASHIVDVCWDSPMNYRQSIAEEMMRAEAEMRDSYSGRAVWRNWSMDKYKTRKQLWFAIGKEEEENTPRAAGLKAPERVKTAIELARERHAMLKGRQFATGSNAPLTGAKRGAVEMGEDAVGKRQKVEEIEVRE